MTTPNTLQYYLALGLDATATEHDIRLAYKKLAIKWHPDKNKDPTATEQFQRISTAYRKLTAREDGEEEDTYTPEDIFFQVFGPLFADLFDCSSCHCSQHHQNHYATKVVDSEDELYSTEESDSSDYCYYESEDEDVLAFLDPA